MKGCAGILLGCAFATWLTGCAAMVPTVVHNPGYRSEGYKGRTLHVLPLTGIHIANREDFQDDFKTEIEDWVREPLPILTGLIQDDLRKVSDNLNLVFEPVSSIPGILRDTLLSVPGPAGADSVRFFFPEQDRLPGGVGDPDLALQIQALSFRRDTAHHSGHSGPQMIFMPDGSMRFGGRIGGGEGITVSLRLDGYYLLWDYRAGAPLAYGRLDSQSQFFFNTSKATWETAIRSLVLNIVRDTPLKGPKYVAATRSEQRARNPTSF